MSARESLRRNVLLVIAGSSALFVLLVYLFFLASRHAFGSNSDDATLVLQGQSISSGHLALQGWDLSYDSFWTVDVVFYALGVTLFGVGPLLLNLVPAVVAALLVVSAVAITAQGRRDRGFLAGAAVIVGLLALPGPSLAFFLLQGGWHAATALWCLLIFAGVSRQSGRWSLVGATVLVAAGLLGDLLTLTLVIVPLLLAGAVKARGQRNWRACSRNLVAALGGTALALIVRALALAVGTFAIGSRSIIANSPQVTTNLRMIPSRFTGLFGVSDLVVGMGSSSIALRVVHGLLLILVIVAVLAAFVHLRRSLLSRRRGADVALDRSSLDDILAIAFVCDLASFCVFSTYTAVDFARYLLPGVVFAAVLAARMTVRVVRREVLASPARILAAAAVVIVFCAVDFGADSLGPVAPQEARSLSVFLASKNLRSGVGDYWSSSIVTVDSRDAVQVRPVDLTSRGTLVRYSLQSAASWYSGATFYFFVYDTGNQWHNVTGAAAEKTFGSPSRTYAIGTYRVLVYDGGFHVAA